MGRLHVLETLGTKATSEYANTKFHKRNLLEAGPGTSPVRVTGWGRLWRTWFTCLPSKVFLWILINLLHHSHLLTASEFFTKMDHCFWRVRNFISDQPTWMWYLMAKFTRLTTLWCVFTWVYHVQHVSASRYLHLGLHHDLGNHHMIYPEMTSSMVFSAWHFCAPLTSPCDGEDGMVFGICLCRERQHAMMYPRNQGKIHQKKSFSLGNMMRQHEIVKIQFYINFWS